MLAQMPSAAPAREYVDACLASPHSTGSTGRWRCWFDYILATAIRPQPWLAVGASLAALGALMGRQVRTPSNLRSNLYVLGIAESGGGKDHARKAIKETLFAGRVGRTFGGEQIATGAGLITALIRQPSSCSRSTSSASSSVLDAIHHNM